MSAITQRRRELKQRARERQKELLPKLRARVREARKARQARLRKCAADCRKRKARVQANARKARDALRGRIVKARQKAQAACGACRVDARGAALDKLDRALRAVETEREAIAALRATAAQLRDPRGVAGGRRSAELRSESDDQVARDVADDPELAALWAASNKSRFKASPRRSRTEAFLEWVENHPEALAELRHRQEEQYAREAERLFASWPKARSVGRLSDAELEQVHRELDQAEQFVDQVPF